MSTTTTAPHTRAAWHDAYDAQMGLWRWYRTDGARFLARHFHDNSRNLQPATREMLLDLYQSELNRLIDCDPIYVSREMCEVVEAARGSFAPEALLETDVLTPRGFMFYAQPFEVPDRFDKPTNIAAVAWTRIFGASSAEQRAAFMSTRDTQVDTPDAEEVLLSQGATVIGLAITLYTRPGAEWQSIIETPLLPMHLTPWYIGMGFEGNEWDEIGKPTGAEWWWRLVQTTFRLMQQKIAVKHFKRPDRAARRNATKLGVPEREIVVVHLRREASEAHEPSGESANYSHRFIVSGHWRNQYYPSINGHRQIWISPYVKGDLGLPLIVRPRRVFQWDR